MRYSTLVPARRGTAQRTARERWLSASTSRAADVFSGLGAHAEVGLVRGGDDGEARGREGRQLARALPPARRLHVAQHHRLEALVGEAAVGAAYTQRTHARADKPPCASQRKPAREEAMAWAQIDRCDQTWRRASKRKGGRCDFTATHKEQRRLIGASTSEHVKKWTKLGNQVITQIKRITENGKAVDRHTQFICVVEQCNMG
eukprot:6199671-Pleurochrysis_carterae.AAC.2